MTPKTETRLLGMADPDFLTPGVYVRFIGTLDKKTGGRSLQEKVTALTVFTPGQTPDRTLGIISPPDSRTPAPGTIPPRERKDGPMAIPGAGPEAHPAPPSGDLPDAKAPGAGKGKKPAEKVEIHGRIVLNRAGKITVDVSTQRSRRKLVAELADNPKIAVDLTDYSQAQAGDSIEVIGNQMGRSISPLQAVEVRIDLAAPLSGPTRPGHRHTVAKRPPVKPGEETAKLPTETPSSPANPPAGKPDKTQQIVQFLQLPPAELAGKHGMTIATKDGTNLDFAPCRPEPTKAIIEKFGQPDHIALPHLTGSGPDGEKTQLAWQLWIYGDVMFFVDETGAARYYAMVPKPDKKAEKKPDNKPEKKE